MKQQIIKPFGVHNGTVAAHNGIVGAHNGTVETPKSKSYRALYSNKSQSQLPSKISSAKKQSVKQIENSPPPLVYTQQIDPQVTLRSHIINQLSEKKRVDPQRRNSDFIRSFQGFFHHSGLKDQIEKEQQMKQEQSDNMACDPHESNELESKLGDMEKRIQSKIEDIKTQKGIIQAKDSYILELEQKLNDKLTKGCLKCDLRNIVINKLKNQVSSQNDQLVESLRELENPKELSRMFQYTEDQNVIQQCINNQIQVSKTVVKDIQQSIKRLDQGNASIQQASDKMQSFIFSDRQDLLTQIHSLNEEVDQLRLNEERLKKQVDLLQEENLQFRQLSQQKVVQKINREVQVNTFNEQQIPNRNVDITSKIERLSTMSDLLIAQTRILQ